jgi:hypothetical protein
MATFLTAAPQSFSGDLTSNSTVPLMDVGTIAYSNDGRKFRYCYVDSSAAIVPGKLYQAPVEITNHENLAPTANVAIGATSLTVTLGNTAATANQYAGGWMVVTVTPGQGYQYKIKSHPAASGSATLTLQLEDPIVVALTTAASKVDLVMNPYGGTGVLISATGETAMPVGVGVYPIDLSHYGFIQVGGPANVLADGAITCGTNVVVSNGTPGAVEPLAGVQGSVGVAMEGIATTEYGMVDLNIG